MPAQVQLLVLADFRKILPSPVRTQLVLDDWDVTENREEPQPIGRPANGCGDETRAATYFGSSSNSKKMAEQEAALIFLRNPPSWITELDLLCKADRSRAAQPSLHVPQEKDHERLDKPTTANPEKAEATQEIEDVVEINMKGMGKDMWQKFDWKLFSDKALRREFLNIPGKSTKSLSAGSAAKIILARGAGFGRTAKVAPKRILEGSVVTFHFVAKLKSGKIIDSSYFRPTPQICQVSRKGNLVDALNFCLIGMHVGEKALVRSTFHYAYGEFGCPPLVPPKSSVLFYVHVVDAVIPVDTTDGSASIVTVSPGNPQTTMDPSINGSAVTGDSIGDMSELSGTSKGGKEFKDSKDEIASLKSSEYLSLLSLANQVSEECSQHKARGNAYHKSCLFQIASFHYQIAVDAIQEHLHSFQDLDPDSHQRKSLRKLWIDLHNNLALLYSKNIPDLRLSNQYASQVLQADPSNLKARLRRVYNFLQQEELESALTDLQIAETFVAENKENELAHVVVHFRKKYDQLVQLRELRQRDLFSKMLNLSIH